MEKIGVLLLGFALSSTLTVFTLHAFAKIDGGGKRNYFSRTLWNGDTFQALIMAEGGVLLVAAHWAPKISMHILSVARK